VFLLKQTSKSSYLKLLEVFCENCQSILLVHVQIPLLAVSNIHSWLLNGEQSYCWDVIKKPERAWLCVFWFFSKTLDHHAVFQIRYFIYLHSIRVSFAKNPFSLGWNIFFVASSSYLGNQLVVSIRLKSGGIYHLGGITDSPVQLHTQYILSVLFGHVHCTYIHGMCKIHMPSWILL